MATIEPRLIHLLNESTTPQVQHADLPPLYSLPLPTPSERSLPPLEPDASLRCGADLGAGASALSLSGDDAAAAAHRKDDARWEPRLPAASSAYPLRLLLGDSDPSEAAPHPHPKPVSEAQLKLFGDAPDENAGDKKRTRGLGVKDDFVQLPQPVKKQKATQQALAMPPIINGLHEPPPHAALFPPIASDSFSQRCASQMKLLPDLGRAANKSNNTPASSDADKNAHRGRKRATKPRRKWSEEETKHLLLGVNRHGVGKWTTILENPDFTFNDRTAGDLKDRFRTCCPVELRRPGGAPQPDSPPPRPREPGHKAKKGIHSENILIEEDEASPTENAAGHPRGPEVPRQKKTRAHRKNMEDLAVLGIHGPFKKSLRRERRPFTDVDDREILEGLDIYGPAWTKIQRDPRFQLSTRQPTDLRDRVRNKYPGVYQRIEKITFQAKDEARGSDTLEPSVRMSIDDLLGRPKTTAGASHASRNSSKEELSAWPLQMMDASSNLHAPQSLEFGDASAPPFTGSGRGIPRILVDDSRRARVPPRLVLDGTSGTPSAVLGSEHRRDRRGAHPVTC